MTPHFFSSALSRPSDFIIRTEASLRYFLLKTKVDRKERLSASLRLAITALAKLQIGTLDLILPNGRKITFQGKIVGTHAALAIHNDRVIKRFLTKGKLGFCESYLDGDWSSPDMALFFELMLKNEHYLRDLMLGKQSARFIEFLFHIARPNSKEGSRKNIYDHYDIGNDFYARWLDKSMTYSSALFADGITDLHTAQIRKYYEICRSLNLKDGMSILEIGCGWGGFAEYVATNFDIKLTCITISMAQYNYAVNRIKNLGLDHKVEIRIQDYRDVTETFDRIVSIEMFEAVGEQYWPIYFDVLKQRLNKHGRATLQIITINETDFPEYRKTADYIQKYIFPGGMLPTVHILQKLTESHGLKWDRMLSFGRDYARTLLLWNDTFQAEWPNIRSERLNDRFKRLWEQYFAYCKAGFDTSTIDVVHITLDQS
jgi:cyclopropane-fatty-acyl-phospholipid synthase